MLLLDSARLGLLNMVAPAIVAALACARPLE
jgi:hypothetical protein